MINLTVAATKGYPIDLEVIEQAPNHFRVNAQMTIDGVSLNDYWLLTRPQMSDLVDLMRDALQI